MPRVVDAIIGPYHREGRILAIECNMTVIVCKLKMRHMIVKEREGSHCDTFVLSVKILCNEYNLTVVGE